MTIVLLVALAVVSAPAQAFDPEESLREQHPQYEGRVLMRVAQQDGVTLSQAIAMIKRRTNGKIVGAETKVRNGREVHHIKVLTKEGKVRTHKVNGRRR